VRPVYLIKAVLYQVAGPCRIVVSRDVDVFSGTMGPLPTIAVPDLHDADIHAHLNAHHSGYRNTPQLLSHRTGGGVAMLSVLWPCRQASPLHTDWLWWNEKTHSMIMPPLVRTYAEPEHFVSRPYETPSTAHPGAVHAMHRAPLPDTAKARAEQRQRARIRRSQRRQMSDTTSASTFTSASTSTSTWTWTSASTLNSTPGRTLAPVSIRPLTSVLTPGRTLVSA
jgi:hypothetical protein